MNFFFDHIVDRRQETTLATAFRRRRFRLFLALIETLKPPISILDVGGEQRFWEVMGMAQDERLRVALLNIELQPVNRPNFTSLIGDASDLSQFADGAFDVVFSNSVIEHLGSFDRQRRMAMEVQRVGKCYFIQTPNRYFPLEPHFLLPFFQFYPPGLQIALVRRFNLGWYRREPDTHRASNLARSHRLLSAQEMRTLFPNGALYRERLLVLTKSFIVCGPMSYCNGLEQAMRGK